MAALESECPGTLQDGVIHRAKASVWSHGVELMALAGGRDAFRTMINHPPRHPGPWLAEVRYPDVLVVSAHADAAGGLHAVLHGARDGDEHRVVVAGLHPCALYRVEGASVTHLVAGRHGRASERHGHFLLLGLAALEMMQQSSETLAGRVAYIDMAAVDATEAAEADIPAATLWVRGGFPDSVLASDDAHSLTWRRDFIRSYLERDVPMFAPRMPGETVGRLWTMLAYQQGGLLNQARLASSLGVSAPTLNRYMNLMVDMCLVRRFTPWGNNAGKRLVKAPKVYVRDSGLVHAQLLQNTRRGRN